MAMDDREYGESMTLLTERVIDADAVLIGGGMGLSKASGYDHFTWTPWCEEHLAAFRERYGFTSPYEGYHHDYPDIESRWAFDAAYMQAMYDAPTGGPYERLAQILKYKASFIITTNPDGQFQRVFPEDEVFAYQGDFRFLQCSACCSEDVVDAHGAVAAMVAATTPDLRVPSELIPRCPRCGEPMVPWVSGPHFCEGERWHAAEHRYQEFMDRWGEPGAGHRLLLLELGVGQAAEAVRGSLVTATTKVPRAFYAMVNHSRQKLPQEVAERGLRVSEDLGKVLEDVLEG